MRLSYTLLATAAALLASCDAAFAMAESTQVATADRVQPAVVLTNDTPGKRLLRTAKTVGVGEDDEEERGLDVLKKLLPQAVLDKFLKKNPLLKEMPETYVTKLLAEKQLRKETFHYWYKSDIDGEVLANALRTDDPSLKLLGKYKKFLSE
ncbi:hypothetical protein PR001_g17134 [Phytophthora rubi]|uniref:RxLR effector protein n=1 Tax=Phytophthora rubi TaxID=129364 RepID=A0A6A3KB14_9STRA|nr:hypothetical protein PR002_g17090 [Phytophthora rubi]KAE9006752.1 hypothetical protein PR001_g17134 [Phytophthora rubi]